MRFLKFVTIAVASLLIVPASFAQQVEVKKSFVERVLPFLVTAPKVGDELTLEGRIVRIMTKSYDIATPVRALVLQEEGKAFWAYVRADSEGFNKYAALALGDTLTLALESQKAVKFTGKIIQLGSTGVLGKMVIDYISYEDGYVSGMEVTSRGTFHCDESPRAGDPSPCSGHGTVIRVLNTISAPTTLCTAFLKRDDDKIITATVSKPIGFGSEDPNIKQMIANQMLTACHALSVGLSSQKAVYVGGTLRDDGDLRTGLVNVLLNTEAWGSDYSSAF